MFSHMFGKPKQEANAVTTLNKLNEVASKILNCKELEFNKWDGDLPLLLHHFTWFECLWGIMCLNVCGVSRIGVFSYEGSLSETDFFIDQVVEAKDGKIVVAYAFARHREGV